MIVIYLVIGAMLLIAATLWNVALTVVGLGAGWLYRVARGADQRQGVIVSFVAGAVIGILANALFDLGDPLLGPWATVVGFYLARWLPVDSYALRRRWRL